MADVDFDFFDDAPARGEGKNDNELSPRTNKYGGKKKIETKIPSMRTEHSSDESDNESPRSRKHKRGSKNSVEVPVDSSDSESESDHSHRGLNSSGAYKNAWAENSKSNGVRPKSEHPPGRSSRHKNRPANSKQRSRSNSPRSGSRSRSGSGSETDSSDYSSSSDSNDSDITDVSPLPSPKTTARSTGRKSRQAAPKYGDMRPPKSPSVKSEASNRSRPTSGKLNKLLRPDQDSMDLRLLMQAVLEMEQEREREELLLKKPKQPRFYVPQSTSQRKNISFRNDKQRDIDRENTRLMQKIVHYAAEAKRKKQMQKVSAQRRPQPMVGRGLTTSAVNRKREQERIDRENRVGRFYYVSTVNGPTSITRLGVLKMYHQIASFWFLGQPPPPHQKNCGRGIILLSN